MESRNGEREPKSEGVRKALGTFNHKDIVFYGKVVDQYGTPVAAAVVNGQVIYNTGVKSGVLKPQTVTDANGLFAFSGMQGRTLDFNIVKEGYEFMPEGDAFDYTELVSEEKRHIPDSNGPVLLKMWKLQGPEPLIAFDRRTFDIPSDGKPIRIDLTTGKPVEDGGDLIISLKHEVWPRGTTEHRHDWSATVSAVDGGLIETKQRVMNLAPEDRYLPRLDYQETAGERPWIGGINIKLYVKSREKLFSKVQLEIHPTPGNPPSYVALRSWMNPTGRRNLEYDPHQRIRRSRTVRNE